MRISALFVQLDDVLLHVEPTDPDTITVKLLCGWAAGEDGLFSPSNVQTPGGLPEYKAPEVHHLTALCQAKSTLLPTSCQSAATSPARC